jgi:pimeloyl-ACP methyl ester carboxylesterase
VKAVTTGAVRSTTSADGTVIAFRSVGRGPGLVLVGGALSTGADYLALAAALANDYTVHVMERRGRPGSGQQRADHGIEDECADLAAVAQATNATAAFGHSFGGLVVLESARRQQRFDEVYVYDPGVSLRGQPSVVWFDGYQQRLERGDRRGAFAWMVKHADSTPGRLGSMPLWFVRLALRIAIRGPRWTGMDPLLEANLVEHRLLAALDAPNLDRFSTITARTVLLGGAKSPETSSGRLLHELAATIPNATVKVLPGLGHFAPEEQPGRLAAAMREA